MPSELYHEIVAQRGSFERLVARIPGFRGYQDMQARRTADRMLRDYLANEIETRIDRFGRLQERALDKIGLSAMGRMRTVKGSMQAYLDRIRTAMPKYSGMWSSIKIDGDALDRIYAFDELQVRYHMRLDNALDELEAAIREHEGFEEKLDAVEAVILEASDEFAERDDEILRLGDSLP